MMTPEQYLSGLAANLNLTAKEREMISARHTDLREKLREILPVEDDFLTGSYPRDTMIRPNGDDKFDVDFFLAFSNAVFGEYELPKLLDMVRAALEAIRRNNPDIVGIKDQPRSIAVLYGNRFQIDVVPAIEIEKDKLYKIFDKRSQQSVESNPKLHGQLLSHANEATEYGSVRRLVAIIKLLKSWKRDKCDYVKSFHLELLAVEILKDETIQTFSIGLTRFFRLAANYLHAPSLTDPANDENVIDAYLDEDGTRGRLLSLVSAESALAEEALQLERAGDTSNAVDTWRKIFERGGGNGSAGHEPKSRRPIVITRPPKQHGNVQVGT